MDLPENVLSLADTFTNKKVSRKKRNFFNINEGDNIYLPLPPFATLATEGRWITKNATHWGFTVNGSPRPFACPGYGCAKCAFDNGVKETLEKVDAKADPDLHALLKGYTDLHSLAITYDMNAINQGGQIGLLKIKRRMFDSLLAEEKAVSKYGIRFATVQNGTWINFKKTGKGSTAVWVASALRQDKEVDGGVAQMLVKTTITPEILKRMEEEAFDLSKVSMVLTHDQVKALVASIKDYDVDQDLVDQVFSQKNEGGASITAASGLTNTNKQAGVQGQAMNPSDPLAKYF